jgi:predicted nucleic-acid-binding protein
MIGLDTNILIRAATNDDPIRSPKARAIIAALTPEQPAVVNSVVLAEFAWSLRTGYGYARSEILAAVENMMRSLCYVVPDRSAINAALIRCESEGLDFADALIGEINLEGGAEKTLTFDAGCFESSAFRPVT